MKYIVVGLGNPGEEYYETRHNTGRLIVEALAKDFSVGEWKEDKKLKALRARGRCGTHSIEFVLPDTFMNRSGNVLTTLVGSIKAAERLVVVHDDLDLPFPTLKVSFNRGSGGHRGVDSIIKAIKTKAFVRFRVGISKATPKGKIKKPSGEDEVQEYILGGFKKDELLELKAIARRAGTILNLLINEGRERAMNISNT